MDVFNARLRPGETFDEAKRREFEQELQTLVRMLASGSAERARERLNRFLTERIEKMNEPLSGLLSPVEVRFDNQLSPDWTVMDAHSEDAFAFLYAFSNALSIRGIYIHKVEIRSVGREARDRFLHRGSSGAQDRRRAGAGEAADDRRADQTVHSLSA